MKKELIAQRSPKSPIAETFRTLRTNIQFMNSQKDLKTILVTSTMPGEGKSWISSNLAITFAQAGKKVVIIAVGVIVCIICLALILTKCENTKKTDTDNPSTDIENSVNDTNVYNFSASGKISNADSKTVAYFNSHYKGDYRTIIEYMITDESGQQYTQTEKVSYSEKGYKYREIIMDKYGQLISR